MFKNKVVLVTGGSSGIGAATVEIFAKEGADVAFVGRNETKLKEVELRCKQYGVKTLVIKADVAKDEEAKTIVQQTIDKFGKLDVLVNNAGIIRYRTVLEPNLIENFDEIINTNLRSVILITNLAVPHLVKTKGSIINVSSVLSTWSKIAGTLSYCMSKSAMDSFTRGAASELASSGVRVNSVNPGPVITDIGVNSNAPAYVTNNNVISNMTRLNRASDADEVGDLILYLASEKARGITGSCYLIDNGMFLS